MKKNETIEQNGGMASKPLLTAVFCVGDVIIYDSTYHGYSKTKVVRTTNTQAILENGAKLKIDRDGARAIGSNGYGAPHYYKSTPELEAKYKKQNLTNGTKNRFLKLPFDKLSEKELEEIYGIVKSLHAKYCS